MECKNPPLKPKHGLIIIIVMRLLHIVAWPCYAIHNCLKEQFATGIAGTRFGRWLDRRTDRSWDNDDRQGLFIELWVIFWLIFNLLVMHLLGYIPASPWWIRALLFLPVLFRFADLLRAFLLLNFYMVAESQRSVARSYALLVSNFFEVAAIFASAHLLFYEFIRENCTPVGAGSLYFYTITSMLTIDQSTFGTPEGASQTMFYVFKVLQPLFGVLFLAMAVGRILDWKNQINSSDDGNGG